MFLLAQGNLLRSILEKEKSKATRRMIRLAQGTCAGFCHLLTKSHNSKSIHEWKEYLKMPSYKTKKRKNKPTKLETLRVGSCTESLRTDLKKKVIWSSVKNLVSLFTRWATCCWSNWDKPRRLFSVLLAWNKYQRDSPCVHVASGFDTIKYDGPNQTNICCAENSVLSYSSNSVTREEAERPYQCRCWKKGSKETRQPHLFTEPMAERNIPSVSGGVRMSTPQPARAQTVVLTLGGDDMEAGVPDKEQVDCEREKFEVRDKEKEDKTRTNNAHSNMWHHGWHADGVTAHLRHLEPRCECDHMCKVHEKNHVSSVSVYTLRRSQWIAIDCKRNQL